MLGRRQMVRGMPVLDPVERICDVCVTAKQRRAAFPQAAKFRAARLLDLVHEDICGPITLATPDSRCYFLLLVDDRSRYMWVLLLSAKGETTEAVKRFKVAAEMESGRKLRVLRMDNGGEFTSAEFAEYCADQGVRCHLSAPYSPQQNGVVER